MGEKIISFIFPDFELIEAIKYEFPVNLILIEEVALNGFEIYLVEQWLSERKLSTLITTYTGSSHDSISAVRLTIMSDDESIWPVSLKSYIKELVESLHCKPKETESGIIYVTNLAQFPSYLNLIEVDKGNMKEVWEIFNVNLNLKKMGCSGRSVLTLSQPTKSMQDKFRQTYKISHNVNINFAARELVLIIQTFLYYYNLFPANHCDGVLCDQTEEAIQNWWSTIGINYYGSKLSPGEGLTCSSVCAIISFTMNLKFRLELLNTNSIDVPKDPLSVERFRLCIGQFQKYSQKYSSGGPPVVPQQNSSSLGLFQGEEFSYFLDHPTIDSLIAFSNHKMNSQQFKNDFNKVKKLLKNTVSDISSGRTYLNLSSSNAALPLDSSANHVHDLENLNDLLTLDINKMINFLQGKRLLYLWKGKGKEVNIDEVSLSKSIREQLSKQNVKMLTQNGSGSVGSGAVDYLNLPSGSLSHSTSNNTSLDKKYYSDNAKSSTNGSTTTETPAIYDPTECELDNFQDFNKYSENEREPSSVFDDWIFLDNDKNFEVQLNRRCSFPYIDKELNRSMLSHRRDYPSWDYSNSRAHLLPKEEERSLKKTNSFSLLESSILLWDYQFSPSVNRLATEYLAISEELTFNVKDSTNSYAEYISQIEKEIESDEPSTHNPFNGTAVSSNNNMSNSNNTVNKRPHRTLDSKTIEELSRRVVGKKEFLDLKLRDIDLLNSRLAYEVRLLTNKVKDVQDNLHQLQDFKVKKVMENLALYQQQRPVIKERLENYQELQQMLSGGDSEGKEIKGTSSVVPLMTTTQRDTFLVVISLYLLAVWNGILKLFNSQDKMDDKISSDGFGIAKDS